MLTEQIDRIRLIERLIGNLWNIGSGSYSSGYRRSSKIIMKVLQNILDNTPVTVGLGPTDCIPKAKVSTVPWELIDEVRKAGITNDDIEKVRARRDFNLGLLMEIVEKMLVNGYQNFFNIETSLNRMIMGENILDGILTLEDREKVKKAEMIKYDFTGIFFKTRLLLMRDLTVETSLTPQQIFTFAILQSEKKVKLMSEKIFHTKEIIRNEFDRLKWHNVSATDAIQDLIAIGKNGISRYANIRSSQSILNQRIDFEMVEFIAAKIAPPLDREFAILKKQPIPKVVEPEIQVKTAEELAAEQQIRDNAVESLIIHFHLKKADAVNLANRTPINHLNSLWHIKMNVMPKIEKVLEELMETFNGNVQMVEDIVTLEQLAWSNTTEAFRKYKIPVPNHRHKHGVNPVSVIENDQSDILLTLHKDLTLDLIKPLRENLTHHYQLRHPGKEVQTGRDINKFREYAFLSKWKTVPEFMFNMTGIEHVLNNTVLSDVSTGVSANKDVRPPQRGFSQNDAMLTLDLAMITFLIGYLLHLYRKHNQRRKYFIETANSTNDEKVVLIEIKNVSENRLHAHRT